MSQDQSPGASSTDAATIDPRSAPDALRAWLDRMHADVDDELARRLPVPARDHGRLVEGMRYAVLGPGKRLRPAFVLAACEAVGGTRAAAMPAAAAVEMLHAYTLVHDDLPALDDDDERRGRPTVHIVFGEAMAVLIGDGLLTAAFAALAELGRDAADAVRVLATRAGHDELIAGQALDLSLGGRTPTLEELEQMHAGKTGALFAAAAELGAIAGGGDARARAALARYGMAMGVAFQHADDRDDGEFAQRADAARQRMRALCDEAEAIARDLGEPGDRLAALAAWWRDRA